VISLKESWQVQRKQRQYEVVQRQQQVRETLEQFQQKRQVKAAELREALRLFQLELQLDTQDFLAQANSQRQTQAAQVMQQLHSFVQALRQNTAQMVAIHAADRATLSQQVRQDLSDFHVDLSLSVTLLRQTLQQQRQAWCMEVQDICVNAQELLQAYHHDRIQNRIGQIQTLTDWTEKLQAEVKKYLTELSLIRHDRTHQLQGMLQADRDRRCAEMHELFQQLAQFRVELKDYCTEIHQTVFGGNAKGDDSVEFLDRNKTENSPEKRTTSKRAMDISQVQKNGKISGSQSQGNQGSRATKQLTKHPASRPSQRSPVPQRTKPEIALEPSHTGSTQAANPQTPTPSSPHPDVSSQLLSDLIEQRVYTHLQQTHGARLTEIETVLGINRFQAVDALRSLIKKGLVTQRDRVYLIQEELSL
jgi:hypothetical protein